MSESAATAPGRLPLAAAMRAVAVTLPLTGGLTYISYWLYSEEWHGNPDHWPSLLAGHGFAPEQYRVGALWTAAAAQRWLHLPLRYGFTLLDFAALLALAVMFAAILRRLPGYRDATPAQRLAARLAAAALATFSGIWLSEFHRPETLPASALATGLAMLFERVLRRPQNRPSSRIALPGIVVLALVLGTLRADVAVAIGAGGLVCALAARPDGRSGLRSGTIAGVLTIAIACALTWWLAHVAFPQATTGGIPRWQLVRNFRYAHRLVPFTLFVAPLVAVGVAARRTLEDKLWRQLATWSSAAFFIEWLCLGRFEEVRIGVPMAVLWLPVAAALALAAADTASANRRS